MAAEPYGSTNLRIIKGLSEPALADVQIWLLRKAASDGDDHNALDVPRTGPAVVSPFPEFGWSSLRNLIANNLLFRATPASTAAIRKVRKIFPNELWGRLERDSAELVRDASWIPLSPSEFLDLALAPPQPGVETEHPQQAEKQAVDDRSTEPEPHLQEPVTFERRFKRTGDTWDLMFGGACFTVKHTKGMAYIHLLLQSPDRPVDAWQMSAASGGAARNQLSDQELAELSRTGDIAEPVLDGQARSEYKTEIADLRRQIAEAERNNDLGRVEGLRSQEEMIIQQLGRDTGMGGQARRFTTEAEKARKAVSRAIGIALGNIDHQSKKMKELLDSRIDRGASCTYRSDGVDWDV